MPKELAYIPEAFTLTQKQIKAWRSLEKRIITENNKNSDYAIYYPSKRINVSKEQLAIIMLLSMIGFFQGSTSLPTKKRSTNLMPSFNNVKKNDIVGMSDGSVRIVTSVQTDSFIAKPLDDLALGINAYHKSDGVFYPGYSSVYVEVIIGNLDLSKAFWGKNVNGHGNQAVLIPNFRPNGKALKLTSNGVTEGTLANTIRHVGGREYVVTKTVRAASAEAAVAALGAGFGARPA